MSTNLFDLINQWNAEEEERLNPNIQKPQLLKFYSDAVRIPVWKIRIIQRVADALGILIHINGVAFGRSGA